MVWIHKLAEIVFDENFCTFDKLNYKIISNISVPFGMGQII